jgi:hypothetical protein
VLTKWQCNTGFDSNQPPSNKTQLRVGWMVSTYIHTWAHAGTCHQEAARGCCQALYGRVCYT